AVVRHQVHEHGSRDHKQQRSQEDAYEFISASKQIKHVRQNSCVLKGENTSITKKREPLGASKRTGLLNRFGDTTNGERIPRGKPWYSHRISGKQRPESGDCSRVCDAFPASFPQNG